MERLTGETIGWKIGATREKLADRLRPYENIGLTPEQIRELKERVRMTYIIHYNGDGTVTIREEIYKELREKANNYQKLVDIMSKAIKEAIQSDQD